MRLFLVALITMHLTTMMSGQVAHCHGDSCASQEVEHAFLNDHGHDHGHDAPAQQDNDDDDNQPSKLHGWHSHSADIATIQIGAFDRPIADKATLSWVVAPLVSMDTEPLLEPPSLV